MRSPHLTGCVQRDRGSPLPVRSLSRPRPLSAPASLIPAYPRPGDATLPHEFRPGTPGAAGVWSYAGAGRPEERESLSGLVTLALLAILGAFIVTRVMRRIGLSMSRSNTFGFMFAFVVVVLMVWGQTLNK